MSTASSGTEAFDTHDDRRWPVASLLCALALVIATLVTGPGVALAAAPGGERSDTDVSEEISLPAVDDAKAYPGLPVHRPRNSADCISFLAQFVDITTGMQVACTGAWVSVTALGVNRLVAIASCAAELVRQMVNYRIAVSACTLAVSP